MTWSWSSQTVIMQPARLQNPDSTFQASMDWEPYTPVFRKEALPTAVLYGPFPLEGRHGTGYLQQPSSREELVQITIPQANSGMRIA